MSQHDMNIANQGFPAFRSDLNNALTALVSTSSGATEPTTMFANQLWYDTATDTLKIRDEANAAWISVLTLDQTNDRVAQFLGNSSDTATAPSFTWGGDPNTGMYNPAADQIGLTTGGTARLTITTAQFTGTLPWRGQAGTAADPAISTSGDTNTGIFFPAADTIAFAEGGAEVLRLNSDAQVVTGAGTVSLPAVTATGDLNTGIFYPAADTVAVTTGGSERVRVASAGQIGIAGANYGTSGQVLTSGGASAAPSWATPTASVINTQTFDTTPSAPGWTKPSGYSANSRVLIQAWGGGGSGARQSTSGSCGGGGGGGYNERWLNLSQMGATETVTIGAGGVSRTGSNQAGDQGGNTTVGSLITAYGGAGSPVTSSGGGGGGQLSAGSGQAPGRPNIQTDETGGEYKQGGGSTAGSTLGRNDALFHGGGGGFGTLAAQSGSSSVWGGGGGGGGNATAAAGSSSFGGNGGAGGATGTAGTQPGGGGGGGTTTSGAGAAGRVIITVFPA